ncbi:MAG: hypothetical protein DRI37_03475 [Chloroflexi bacterium]|nr:MAG: hypothetical protein DRI37_03475 [Chloroflexota bacterium]
MVKLNLISLIHAKVGQQETITLELDTLKIDDLRLDYLRGDLQLTRVADGVLAKGNLETSVETECVRCLETFFEPVVIELEDVIGLPGADVTVERPVCMSKDGWADLSPLIRECAWLGLPINPICAPDCRGLCPQCGGNLNRGECTCETVETLDPRWEALRSLLNEKA